MPQPFWREKPLSSSLPASSAGAITAAVAATAPMSMPIKQAIVTSTPLVRLLSCCLRLLARNCDIAVKRYNKESMPRAMQPSPPRGTGNHSSRFTGFRESLLGRGVASSMTDRGLCRPQTPNFKKIPVSRASCPRVPRASRPRFAARQAIFRLPRISKEDTLDTTDGTGDEDLFRRAERQEIGTRPGRPRPTRARCPRHVTKKMGTASCARKNLPPHVPVRPRKKNPLLVTWVAASRRSDSDKASHNGCIGSFHTGLLSNTAGAKFLTELYHLTHRL